MFILWTLAWIITTFVTVYIVPIVLIVNYSPLTWRRRWRASLGLSWSAVALLWLVAAVASGLQSLAIGVIFGLCIAFMFAAWYLKRDRAYIYEHVLPGSEVSKPARSIKHSYRR